MDVKQVLKEMEALGTEQNRKIYDRHGVQREMFGLSFANLKKLAKIYKKDHNLALELWLSENHDARLLACMIADPKQMSAEQLDNWVKDLGNYVLTDAFSGMAVKNSAALEKIGQWTDSDQEWVSTAGWNILAHTAMKNANLDDDFFQPYLECIRKEIHNRKNRVRYSMNNVLIAIGVRNEQLQKKALKIAKEIGQVHVEHGETGCKTPDAHNYILKTVARKKKQTT